MHDCNSKSGDKVIDEVCFPVVIWKPGKDGQEGEDVGFPVEVLVGESACVFDEVNRGGGVGGEPVVPVVKLAGG